MITYIVKHDFIDRLEVTILDEDFEKKRIKFHFRFFGVRFPRWVTYLNIHGTVWIFKMYWKYERWRSNRWADRSQRDHKWAEQFEGKFGDNRGSYRSDGVK